MAKELVSINQYGGIELQIRKYMELRGMNRNSLARAINARFEVVDKWCNKKVEKIDSDVLARLCFVLECEPGDLITYVKPDDIQEQSE